PICDLRRRPALLGREFRMNEVQSIKRVILVVDAPVHVDAASGARVALDDGIRVDDLELVLVRRHPEIVARRHCNLRKERPARFPAPRTTANVVVRGLTLDRYGDLVVGTLAGQRATGEVCRRGLDTVVNRRMDGKCGSHALLLTRSLRGYRRP